MSDETELNKMFDLAKRTPPEPSPDFMARILSDAEAMQPVALGVLTETAAKRGIFRDMLSALGEAIGGWPAFAGLATAAVTGVWIGISPPQLLIEPFDTVLGTDSSALSEVLEYGDGFDFTLFKG